MLKKKWVFNGLVSDKEAILFGSRVASGILRVSLLELIFYLLSMRMYF